MEHQRFATLHAVCDNDLLHRLGTLVSQSRAIEADLVAHIGEVDRRRLYARFAVPSMHAYCTEILHLSEASAYRRIAVARAAREFPVLLDRLADGRLHLSGLARLVPHLTPENCDSVLARAVHRSKREIEDIVAELSPRPDVPAVVRKLPERRVLRAEPEGAVGRELPELAAAPSGNAAAPFCGVFGSADENASRRAEPSMASPLATQPRYAGSPPGGGRGERNGSDSQPADVPPSLVPGPVTVTVAVSPSSGEPPHRNVTPGSIQPLSPSRYKVQFTAGADLRDKLDRLRTLMRSTVPDGDLAAIIDAAVTEKLQRLETRRFGSPVAGRHQPDNDRLGGRHNAQRASTSASSSRHIPAAVRRAVRERDGDRCAFVDAEGRRCTGRGALEFHHRRPYAHGGGHMVENIGLLCRSHNAFLAEVDYGSDAHGGRKRTAGQTP